MNLKSALVEILAEFVHLTGGQLLEHAHISVGSKLSRYLHSVLELCMQMPTRGLAKCEYREFSLH
jgi:hypothetical protein